MPLKQPLLVKTVLGATRLTLKADPGEAFKIKNVFIRDPSANYLSFKIDKATVGFFRVGGTLGSHLAFRRGRAQHSHTVRVDGGSNVTADQHYPLRDGNSVDRKLLLGHTGSNVGDVYDEVRALLWSGFGLNETILSFLEKLGVFKGFPVAEGQEFTIEPIPTSINGIQVVVYEQWDPADIKSDQENGATSKEYFYLNYGNTGAIINAAGDQKYDTPQTAAEFPDFPFGAVVPAKHEIDIIGVCASPFAPGENEGTNYCYTQFLKFVKEREVLFDEDRNGILFLARSAAADGAQDMKAEGFTFIGNLSEFDNNPPLIFPQPLTFSAGDELNIYVTTVKGGSGQNIDVYEQEIALIQKVRRIEG
jgi:hypothetical protein